LTLVNRGDIDFDLPNDYSNLEQQMTFLVAIAFKGEGDTMLASDGVEPLGDRVLQARKMITDRKHISCHSHRCHCSFSR
jgi:hypothetical protein